MDGHYEASGHRDYTGAKVGMWLFLFTEFFLFFGPVLLYSVFRHRYPSEFLAASTALSLRTGAVNTVILLTSSLTVALSISALQRGRRASSVALLLSTSALGAVFLVNKYFEWADKVSHGLYPGSAELAQGGPGGSVFYGLYFFTTGLHAVHVLAGVMILLVVAVMILDGKVTETDPIKAENAGLYWHLVDVIWIYLFPVFYLIRS